MKLLIVDDHDLVRDILTAFLDAAGEFDLTTARNLDEAIAVVEAEGPFQLVLLDYQMPGMNGIEGLTRMQALDGAERVALMSGIAEQSVAREALSNGAAGFLPKTMAAKSLVHAIRFMCAGEQFAPLDFMTKEIKEEPHPLAAQMSARERQVLDGLCRGLSNKEIARELDLQEVTIKLHVKTLCRKLDARNRTHAAMIAKEAGLA